MNMDPESELLGGIARQQLARIDIPFIPYVPV